MDINNDHIESQARDIVQQAMIDEAVNTATMEVAAPAAATVATAVAARHMGDSDQPRQRTSPRKPKKRKGQPSDGEAAKKKSGKGQNFTEDEIIHLLNIVQDKKPACQKGWEKVARDHAVQYRSRNRSYTTLKSKFNNLVKAKPKTGETEPGPHVIRARALNDLIYSGTGGTNMDYDDEYPNPDDPLSTQSSEVAEILGIQHPTAGWTTPKASTSIPDYFRSVAAKATNADQIVQSRKTPMVVTGKKPVQVSHSIVSDLMHFSAMQDERRSEREAEQRILDRKDALEREERQRALASEERARDRAANQEFILGLASIIAPIVGPLIAPKNPPPNNERNEE
jgi:hypothetical protein